MFSLPIQPDAGSLCRVLCCTCGISMEPNPSSMCANCLKNQVDITSEIPRSVGIGVCRECNRYLKPPWVHCEPESRELLALCLKKIRGLNSVRLVDASFIWTEPHSKRLKVKLTVQREVVNGAVLQQVCVVEFVVTYQQCDDCKRTYTPHTWTALVQVRQRANHKRTLLFLEQLILKHHAHENVLNVVDRPDGLDFQFAQKQSANRFEDFVASFFPTRTKTSKQLVSHDSKNNTAQQKHTLMIELCPLCTDDLVVLPPRIASLLGGLNSLLLVRKISTYIHLIDPYTLRGADVPSEKYWKNPFDSIYTRRHLSTFIVLDIRDVPRNEINTAATGKRFVVAGSFAASSALGTDLPAGHDGQNQLNAPNSSGRPLYKLVDVEIARMSDFGKNDERMTVRSHLGQSLRPGDLVQGYDLRNVNLSGYDDVVCGAALAKIPYEVVLVRKTYTAWLNNSRTRTWKLQEIPKESTVGSDKVAQMNLERDRELLRQDLEADVELRKDVNIWRDPAFLPPSSQSAAKGDVDMAAENRDGGAESTQGDQDAAPVIRLCEMLEGLSLRGDLASADPEPSVPPS